jgi:hypothetical protein
VTVRKKSNVLWIGILAFGTVVLGGCLKSVDNNQNQAAKTYLSVLHLSPASPTTEVYLNTEKSSSGIQPGTYSLAYSGLTPGIFSITFKKSGSDSVIATIPGNLYDSLAFHSLLLYDDPNNPGKATAAAIEDDFSVLTTSSSFYRFFQFSPSLTNMAVDFYIDDTKVGFSRNYADNVYGSFNSFSNYTPGYHALKVKKAGSDSLIAQSSWEFLQGNAYTVFLKGVANGSGNNALGIAVLQASN